MEILKKLKIGLPYDPEILLLGKYLKKMTLIPKDTCTPMIISILFTVVKIWEQLNIHHRWMDKDSVVYTHTPTHTHTYTHNGISLSHKKEWNLIIWKNIDGLEGIMLTEMLDRERQTCGI